MVFLRHRTRLKSLLLAIIIIILGCQETTSPTCSEIACLTDTVVPALSCQTEECTVMYRDKMQSLIPTQQLGIALELARRYPNGQASHLCDWLTEAMDRESCEVWHRRPHLWTPLFPSRPLQPNQKKSASTPPGECSKHESPAACVLQVAVQLGEIGDLENIKKEYDHILDIKKDSDDECCDWQLSGLAPCIWVFDQQCNFQKYKHCLVL